MRPIVKILQGSVEGVQAQDFDGNTFYTFLGIPYAKPPVGDLRFKDPQPADSWVGVRDAKQDGSSCYQNNFETQQIEGSEDCLYLNVFTRELPFDSYNLKPVMVWIHGGGFIGGSNSSLTYGPEFLLTEDVVIVSINYRVGFLGFLRLKDPQLNVSGNMGLKDQVEALRWVKGNIQQFNGDPQNVTLFGESAGAVSVHYHVLSPLSRDLFHKAIMQSGAALNPWCDECDHSAVQIAKIHDTSISTEKEALEILKNLSVEDLYKVQVAFVVKSNPVGGRPLIGPVIEPASRKTAFINKRPIDIITSGEYNKVPLIFGYNNREGILFTFEKKARGLIKTVVPGDFIPYNVDLRKHKALKDSFIDKLQNLYLNGPDEDENITMLLSDAWFIAGIIGSVKNHSQTSAYPVYLYKLSLETQLNFIKMSLNLSHVHGCSHADDIGYLFKTKATPQIASESIEELSLRRMLRLWTNFARFGNPTPDEALGLTWKPTMSRQLNTLHITETLQMEVNPERNRMSLWKQLYHQNPKTINYL